MVGVDLNRVRDLLGHVDFIRRRRQAEALVLTALRTA